MADTVIRVDSLSKMYRIGAARQKGEGLRHTLEAGVKRIARRLRGYSPPAAPVSEEFWALKDVSFEVKRGECVGVIGRNGAGKSTLLKVISRITEPTSGQIGLKGRVGSLLEVGTGFHPELTGRENIFLNGAILGMGRKEIARKFDEIVAFSEVEKFLETPVKYYSSGMYTRLAFSVAAHLEPEILIVDEVLAVGDVAFQNKCLGKMQDVAAGGRTVLFVSHNMPTLRRLTGRCVFLRKGEVVCADTTAETIDRYLADVFEPADRDGVSRPLDFYRRGSVYDSSVRFQELRVASLEEGSGSSLRCGDSFRIETVIQSEEAHSRACLSFWLSNERGERVATFFSGDAGYWFPIRPGQQTISCTVRDMPLAPGRYTITIGVNRTATTLAFDVLIDYPAIVVTLPGLESGKVEWPERPWGIVHWKQVDWQADTQGVRL